MRNLEQIRAANALAYAEAGVKTHGAQGGEVVKKLPALIMSNGLLAAAAFAYAKGPDEGWYVCFDYLAKHLGDELVGAAPRHTPGLKELLAFLTSRDATSETLKIATEESLAWLAYARRFVRKGPEEETESDTAE
jgi:CRISPR/Cas system CMR-associated protein Cmr5 small subunit